MWSGMEKNAQHVQSIASGPAWLVQWYGKFFYLKSKIDQGLIISNNKY